MNRKALVGAAAVMVALATACNPGADQPDGSDTSSSPAGREFDLPPELRDPRIDRDAVYDERALQHPDVLADGYGLRTIAVLDGELPDGSPWLPVAAMPDGRILGGTPSDRGERVFLIDPKTEERTTLLDHRWGVFAADANDRWIVWVMSGAKSYFTFPWELWSYDRKTGEVAKIAEAPDVGVEPVPAGPDGTSPTLYDGMVYLSAVEEVPKRGQPEPAIYRVPADGSEPMSKMIDHAYGPLVTNEAMYYTVGTGGSFRTWDTRVRNLETGRDSSVRSVTRGPRRSGDAAGGGALYWQQRSNGRCLSFIGDADDEITKLISVRCRSYPQYYPRATDRYITFSIGRSGYITFLYDRRNERLSRLTTERGTAAEGYGDLVVWEPATGPNKGKIVVTRLTDEPPLEPGDPGYPKSLRPQ